MNELKEKEAQAIKVLRTFEPEEGYVLAYSGGKDSDCIKILAQLAGVKFEAVHNLTTADAPETMQYIKLQPDVRIDWARDKDGKHVTMWNLIENQGLPTRIQRFCCNKLKESANQGRLLVTGVRKAESVNRKRDGGLVKIMGKPKTTERMAQEIGVEYSKPREDGLILNDDNDKSRRMVEQCYRTRKTLVNPILDWTDDDVWEFYIITVARATRCTNADTTVWAVSVALWRGAKNEQNSSNAILNTRKCICTQSTKCLNAAWSKARSFRLRGGTASPKP